MKCGIVVFPGSNCDHDCYHILKKILNQETHWLWHKDEVDLSSFDLIVLPGGFSYGDYLRAGAISRFSPVMNSVIHLAENGGNVLGICNGFQILLESGLLPGALMQNHTRKFICKNVYVRVETTDTPFTQKCNDKLVLEIPIAHHQGSYYIDPHSLSDLEEKGQILFRYCDAKGSISESSNPNGSVGAVAGLCNEQKNVMGMMPHPERCADPLWANTDGQSIFQSLISQS
ncbi:MAG: phosphoribosylformylglycinamidine synthase subunit PurQ [Nitrospinaceae bacterium]|nr:phosphoribosylformylglycinamidine synthase subunit PurQ [Nitrospinaceae bacterium]